MFSDRGGEALSMSVKKEYHGAMDFRLNGCAVMGLFQYVNDALVNSL
jgi:hypothetical protein